MKAASSVIPVCGFSAVCDSIIFQFGDFQLQRDSVRVVSAIVRFPNFQFATSRATRYQSLMQAKLHPAPKEDWPNKTVVATADNAALSLRSASPVSAAPHL